MAGSAIQHKSSTRVAKLATARRIYRLIAQVPALSASFSCVRPESSHLVVSAAAVAVLLCSATKSSWMVPRLQSLRLKSCRSGYIEILNLVHPPWMWPRLLVRGLRYSEWVERPEAEMMEVAKESSQYPIVVKISISAPKASVMGR